MRTSCETSFDDLSTYRMYFERGEQDGKVYLVYDAIAKDYDALMCDIDSYVGCLNPDLLHKLSFKIPVKELKNMFKTISVYGLSKIYKQINVDVFYFDTKKSSVTYKNNSDLKSCFLIIDSNENLWFDLAFKDGEVKANFEFRFYAEEVKQQIKSFKKIKKSKNI